MAEGDVERLEPTHGETRNRAMLPVVDRPVVFLDVGRDVGVVIQELHLFGFRREDPEGNSPVLRYFW
jgi:hypothetical protein